MRWAWVASRRGTASQGTHLQYILSTNGALSLCDERARKSTLAVVLADGPLAGEHETAKIVLDQDRKRKGLIVCCASKREREEAGRQQCNLQGRDLQAFLTDEMGPVIPKAGQVDGADEVALDAHPKTIDEGGNGQSCYEDGQDRGNQQRLTFCCVDAKEEESQDCKMGSGEDGLDIDQHGPARNGLSS